MKINITKKKLIVFAIIIIVILSIVLINSNRSKGIVVQTTEVKKDDISVTVFTTGTIQPSVERDIVLNTSGIAKKIYVSRGDKVEKGEILAKLDLGNLQYRIEAAKSKHEAEKAQLEEAIANINNEKRSLKKQLEIDLLEYQKLERDYEIDKLLFDEGAISKDNLKNSELTLKLKEIRINELEEKINELEAEDNPRIKSLEAQLKQSFSALKELESELESKTIRSPLDGAVLFSDIKPGTLVQSGTRAFKVGNMDDLIIKGEVNEFDAVRLSPSQKVIISGDAFEENLIGILKEIAPSATTRTIGRSSQTTVEVVASIKEEDERIRAGYSGNMEIIIERKEEALLVPLESIITKEESNIVFKVDDSGYLKETIVKTGINNDLYIEIIYGLDQNDLIVINPHKNLLDRQKVKVDD